MRADRRLICSNGGEAAVVRRHLQRHVELTRAEQGCFRFDVDATDDPLEWTVSERFVDQRAFDAHQSRVRNSEWGIATAGIARDYAITKLAARRDADAGQRRVAGRARGGG